MKLGYAILAIAAFGSGACGKVQTSSPDAASGDDTPDASHAVAASIAFGTAPPASAVAESAIPSFTVEVHDAAGNVVTGDDTTQIAISASGAYSGSAGTFAGTTTRTVSAGVATFDDLAWPFPEVVTLTVTASGLPDLGRQMTITTVPYTKILVADQGDNMVGEFVIDATGTPNAIANITGTNTTFVFSWGVEYDHVTNEVVVANFEGPSIDRFPLGATGNIAPSSALIGPDTHVTGPSRPWFDYIHDELYFGQENGNSIEVYARDATGDTAPVRELAGANTGFAEMDSAMVDYATDEVYTTGFTTGNVSVFNRTDTGNVAPKRTISGAATLLSQPFELYVLPEQNELLVMDASSGVLTFPLDASGNVAPTRQLSVGGSSEGFAYDPVSDDLFIPTGNTIEVFHRTDTGTPTPLRTFSTSAAGINSVDDVALAR